MFSVAFEIYVRHLHFHQSHYSYNFSDGNVNRIVLSKLESSLPRTACTESGIIQSPINRLRGPPIRIYRSNRPTVQCKGHHWPLGGVFCKCCRLHPALILSVIRGMLFGSDFLNPRYVYNGLLMKGASTEILFVLGLRRRRAGPICRKSALAKRHCNLCVALWTNSLTLPTTPSR